MKGNFVLATEVWKHHSSFHYFVTLRNYSSTKYRIREFSYEFILGKKYSLLLFTPFSALGSSKPAEMRIALNECIFFFIKRLSNQTEECQTYFFVFTLRIPEIIRTLEAIQKTFSYLHSFHLCLHKAVCERGTQLLSKQTDFAVVCSALGKRSTWNFWEAWGNP